MTYIEIYFLHTMPIVLVLCVTGLEINYYLFIMLPVQIWFVWRHICVTVELGKSDIESNLKLWQRKQ